MRPSSLSVEWSAVEMPVLKEVILRTSRALSVYAHGALLSMIYIVYHIDIFCQCVLAKCESSLGKILICQKRKLFSTSIKSLFDNMFLKFILT